MNAQATAESLDSIVQNKSSFGSESLRQSLSRAITWTLVAIAAFFIAYQWTGARPLAVLYLYALVKLARTWHWRLAFYPGLAVGVGTAALQLNFFFTLFSAGAVALWFVFAFWIALFVTLTRLSLRWLGDTKGLVVVPFLWMGLEYFRSELYYLRFTWLTPGFAFAEPPWTAAFYWLGVYGTGFVLAGAACMALISRRWWVRGSVLVLFMTALLLLSGLDLEGPRTGPSSARRLKVTGLQMEFPSENEIMIRLRELLRKHPDTELVVLSEYTCDGPVPQKVRDWCAENRRYVVLGGKEPAASRKFYNTAYVIGPDGKTVFQQAKRIPIQFMKDGLPADTQELWDSPWGRIGICICYDLSYTRVTDALVRKGAELLVVPTMDVMDWGVAQHKLHARVAPVRAAEYGLPIFRVASSGISQYVDRDGHTLASAPCPGEGAFIAAHVELGGRGGLPLDRWLGPLAVAGTAGLIAVFLVNWIRRLLQHHRAGGWP